MRRPLTLPALLLGLTLAAPSTAAERCELEVTGTPTPGWDQAVRSLDLSRSDCATLRLELGGDSTRLTFVTRDGRSAVRELGAPGELASTVDALLVTGAAAGRTSEAPAPAERAPEVTRDFVARPRVTTERAASARADAPAGGSDPFATFGLELGARAGSGAVGPVLAGSGSMTIRRWELGVWGSLEPSYVPLGLSRSAPVEVSAPDAGDGRVSLPPEPPLEGNAVGAGVLVGRRVPFSHLDLIVFGRLGVAAVQATRRSQQDAEVRVGTGLRWVFPRASVLRFRTSLGAELMPTDLERSSSLPVPWWALSGTVGVEVGGR